MKIPNFVKPFVKVISKSVVPERKDRLVTILDPKKKKFNALNTTIVKLVADGLKLEIYDDRRLQEEAIRMGVQSEELKGTDKKVPGLFDRIFSEKPRVYLDLLEAVVYEVAKDGLKMGCENGKLFFCDPSGSLPRLPCQDRKDIFCLC